MKWTAGRETLDDRTVRVRVAGETPLSVSEVLGLWASDADFRRFFSGCVRDSGFEAFFWETPAVTLATLGKPFEFVVVEGGGLAAARPDAGAFREHFPPPGGPAVVSFPNLGGDAVLVVPAPVVADHACYTHLGAFLRSAPAEQVDAFWQVAAAAMRRRVSGAPVWLGTAGMGVAWLHLRLDSRPKYYRHREYAREVGAGG